MDESPASSPSLLRRITWVVGVALVAAVVVFGAAFIGDRRAGDGFDLVRWERDTFAGKWLYLLGAPFRDDQAPDIAIKRYFEAAPESAARRATESAVEAALAGRIDAAARTLGLRGALLLSGTVFPPVNVELTEAPRVLVTSPRSTIRRTGTALLRPDLATFEAEAIERRAESEDSDRSTIVVPSGGVATYPAIVTNRGGYADTVATAAHEWMHHYLSFYPLGLHYADSRDATAINETVADIVGDEITEHVLRRWGDPTVAPAAAASSPAATPTSTPRDRTGVDINATLRDLRLEVDGMLAAGQVAEAEARMEAVRQRLWDAGYRIRRINQAYFAWYGTYTARPDATDPLGAQLREVRARSGSLRSFIEVVRNVTSRAAVVATLERMRAGG